MNPSPYPHPQSPHGGPGSGRLDPRHADRYLQATVHTASPARLRLMLIERAVEVARSLAEAWRASGGAAGSSDQALKLLELLNELLSGVTAESGEVGQQVSDLYVFLIQHLLAAEEAGDASAAEEIAVVLQTEAETWRMVCAQQSTSAIADGQRPPATNGGLNLHA